MQEQTTDSKQPAGLPQLNQAGPDFSATTNRISASILTTSWSRISIYQTTNSPMLGFKSFWSACATLAGIELWKMSKKDQSKNSLPAWKQFYNLAVVGQLCQSSTVMPLSEKLATEPLTGN